MKFIKQFILISSVLLLVACTPTPGEDGGRLVVVASTTIVGDVVANVIGDTGGVVLVTLFPLGADPHGYQLTPKDLATIEAAQLVFINGLGLEESVADVIASATDVDVIELAAENNLMANSMYEHEDEHHSEFDPHVWFDPQNILLWVDRIAVELGTLDPDHQAEYIANAASYRDELITLNDWILTEVQQIDPSKRIMVTDHDSFGYFARAYGFEIVGTVIPETSTLAEASAQELAAIEGLLNQYGVQAIFVGTSMNSATVEQVALDAKVQLVPLYTGSLSAENGSASTYLEMMRYNVISIVSALKD